MGLVIPKILHLLAQDVLVQIQITGRLSDRQVLFINQSDCFQLELAEKSSSCHWLSPVSSYYLINLYVKPGAGQVV